MASTRAQIRQRVGELTGLMLYPVPTWASATATTLVSTADLQDSSASSANWQGWTIYRASAATDHQIRRVSSYAGSTGTLTHQGANWTDTTLTSETIELWKIDPRLVEAAINRILIKCFREVYCPLSIWTVDPDMENSGTTAWTDSNATLTKTTTNINVFMGTQALSVAATSANGYAYSAAVPVTPGKQYVVGTMAQASTGTASLVAYDVTNSAAIATVSTTQNDFAVLWQTFTAPSTCESARIHLLQATSGVTAIFDGLWGWQVNQRKIQGPTWLDKPEWIFDIMTLDVPDSGQPAREIGGFQPVHWWGTQREPGSTYPVRIEVAPTPGDRPLYVHAQRPYTAMTAETDSVPAALDWVAAGACWQLYQYLALPSQRPQAERQAYQMLAKEWYEGEPNAGMATSWLAWCQSEQPKIPRRELTMSRPFGVRVM